MCCMLEIHFIDRTNYTQSRLKTHIYVWMFLYQYIKLNVTADKCYQLISFVI